MTLGSFPCWFVIERRMLRERFEIGEIWIFCYRLAVFFIVTLVSTWSVIVKSCCQLYDPFWKGGMSAFSNIFRVFIHYIHPLPLLFTIICRISHFCKDSLIGLYYLCYIFYFLTLLSEVFFYLCTKWCCLFVAEHGFWSCDMNSWLEPYSAMRSGIRVRSILLCSFSFGSSHCFVLMFLMLNGLGGVKLVVICEMGLGCVL